MPDSAERENELNFGQQSRIHPIQVQQAAYLAQIQIQTLDRSIVR
jgi:hypothetical protein